MDADGGTSSQEFWSDAGKADDRIVLPAPRTVAPYTGAQRSGILRLVLLQGRYKMPPYSVLDRDPYDGRERSDSVRAHHGECARFPIARLTLQARKTARRSCARLGQSYISQRARRPCHAIGIARSGRVAKLAEVEVFDAIPNLEGPVIFRGCSRPGFCCPYRLVFVTDDRRGGAPCFH